MEEDLKKTCLYDKHVALNAKMSPFGGFIMPIQYSGIVQEHNAVRTATGLFDVSHMGEFVVQGPDALKFIQNLFTNDISQMQAGQIMYGMFCYPDGGVVDDLLVYKEYEEDSYLLVVNAANIDKDFTWVTDHLVAYDCKAVNVSEKWGQVALQGPDSEKIARQVLGLAGLSDLKFYTFKNDVFDSERLIVSRTGYTGEDGFEFYCTPEAINRIWDLFLEAGVTPCGLECRDTLRFEAGLPLYGDELSAEISPVMAGLGMFCKTDSKDFIGCEALKAQKTGELTQKLVGIEIFDKAIPRAGYPVELEDGTVVGVVTTGYHSISLDKSICFALVNKDYSALDTPLWIRIRKKVFPGKTVKKRFYSTNYKK